jgi:hypothetical protein
VTKKRPPHPIVMLFFWPFWLMGLGLKALQKWDAQQQERGR